MTPAEGRAFVRTLSAGPGVYRMFGARGQAVYVGKARDLRKRVESYFRKSAGMRTQRMMRHVERIEITVTHTETEALLLENNLIKSLKPRFNILLRDDKSYPYIFLSADPFPRLAFHRGARHRPGRYFGPFPSASSVRESLNLLQKVFPVRQCEDSYFRSRSRPCLQYQIHRCTAPCTAYITQEDYAGDVRHAAMFLEGRSRAIITEMAAKMERASAALDFENAARYRDRIAMLRRVQEKQYVMGEGGDLDIVAVATGHGAACVGVTFVRNGRNLGNRNFFPRVHAGDEPAEILGAFLSQYYPGKPVPRAILASHPVPDAELLRAALSEQAGHRVEIQSRFRGARRHWVGMATLNARDGLRRHLSEQAGLRERFDALAAALGFEDGPTRIECFDISHTRGEAAVASCVAFGPEGPVKSGYRRFNISGVEPGDDYAAIAQAVTRRYAVASKDDETRVIPDLIMIDGGKGQLRAAVSALAELGLDYLRVMGVAKGSDRKPGEETLFFSASGTGRRLDANSPALHLIQQIRDEAHRFAITGHRGRRGRARTASVLEEIPGVGTHRRQSLLRHLGGLQEVSRATADELARVPGISAQIAKRIYDTFHGDAYRRGMKSA